MIRFGTAGWRGVIGDEFTFRNVRLVAQGIADTIEPRGSTMVVGHDTRTLSERFAAEAARVLSHNGFRVVRTSRDTPSPVLAFTVAELGAAAGLTITGSHCPPEYNGLKLYVAGGIPAPAAITDRVEARVAEISDGFLDRYVGSDVDGEDPTDAYLAALGRLVDLEAVARADLHLALDPLFGTAHEILDRLLVETSCDCEVIHNFRDSSRSGYSPGFSAETLDPLRRRVAAGDGALGLATDTDADRFAVIDSDGAILDAHDAHVLLLDYLLGDRREPGSVARSAATSHLLDRVAADHGVATRETGVGFRHLGPLLAEGLSAFAFEESAGFGWSRHLPDKDGVLACLLIAELAARHGTPLARRARAIRERVGTSVHLRRDYPLDDALAERAAAALEAPPASLGDRPVREVGTRDGFKLDFGDSWFLYRRSGTKPVLRCYAEAPTRADAEALHEAGRRYLFDPPAP